MQNQQVSHGAHPKQQLGILQAPKQHATGPQQENKRHGHDVQVKHNKT